MKYPLSFAVRKWFWLLMGGLALLPAPSARAQVMEPDGTVMPQPANPKEVAEMISRGFPANSVTLAGLFLYHEINGVAGGDTAIDPINDAHTTPGTFAPQCGLSGTIVLHGGGCRSALGWYNATNPATVPTTIYPIVPANLMPAPPNGISCEDNDFCPLATGRPRRRRNTAGPTRSLTSPPTSEMIRTGRAVRSASR
jgi:hypothetical protein